MKCAMPWIVLGLAALAWPQAGAPARPASKPVSFAILEDYDKGADLEAVERDFEAFKALGIKTWRGSFGWDDYEPARGRYDLDWLRRFAALAARHEIRLRPYLAYTPSWAGRPGRDRATWNNPPRRLTEWTEFVKAVTDALRPYSIVDSYEVYNEENAPQWWDGTAADYGRVLAAAGAVVHRSGGGARVLFGGLVFPDTEWVETVCGEAGAPAAFDVLPIHAYPETWTREGISVETYLDGLPAFLEAADASCGPKPVWINEAGFATTPGRTERDQARWWVRAMATFLARDRVEHIGVYEIRDLPPDRDRIGDAANHHLGLLRTGGRPKIAFETVRLLIRLLDHGTLTVADDQVRLTTVGESEAVLHAHAFARPDGRRVAFAWSDRAVTASLSVAGAVARVTEHELHGTASELPLDRLTSLRLAPNEPRIFTIE